MAWPPSALPPSNRTDATVMASAHPTDHNQLAAAMADVAKFGVWKPFTITQVLQGAAVPITVQRARWCQIGFTVMGMGGFVFNGAGSAGNEIQIIVSGLPAAQGTGFVQAIGPGRYYDAAPGTFYGGEVFMAVNASRFSLEPAAGASNIGIAVAVAASDNIYWSFAYETTAQP